MITIYKMILFLSIVTLVCFSLLTSAYSWPIYSKPEFRGRVIDAETKQPIEGAVVVVLYEEMGIRRAGWRQYLAFRCEGNPNG